MHVEVVAPLRAALGESPVWDVERNILHFVDIFAEAIHQLDPVTGVVRTIATAGPPGAIALTQNGGYVAGVGMNFVLLAEDGTVERLLATALRGDRANDGKCDARGRFVSGTMDAKQRSGEAALYSLAVDGTLTELLPAVTLSNGLDWNPSGDRIYYIDTTTERVDVIEYDVQSGALGERRLFTDLTAYPGRPDGLTVDAEGGVWVAVARAGAVHRYDERGKLDLVVRFPTPIVTSLAFGGQHLDQLYVTSSRGLLAEPQRSEDPLAGAVFVVEGLEVSGRAPHRYAGSAQAN